MSVNLPEFKNTSSQWRHTGVVIPMRKVKKTKEMSVSALEIIKFNIYFTLFFCIIFAAFM